MEETYEYLVETHDGLITEERLNELGNEGWQWVESRDVENEIVDRHHTKQGFRYTFMRLQKVLTVSQQFDRDWECESGRWVYKGL